MSANESPLWALPTGSGIGVQWTEIGAQNVEFSERSQFLAVVGSLEFGPLHRTYPARVGLAIRGVVDEFAIRAERSATGGIWRERYSVFALETKLQRLVFIDRGTDVVCVCLMPAADF